MRVTGLTPILNVSNMAESFAWFEKLGWAKAWDWGDPLSCGSVCVDECQVFLGLNGQGGRSDATATFGPGSDERAERAVWTSMWVDDVHEMHRRCLGHGLEVTWPPTDMPWGVREMHVRHPDGHVFRVSQALDEAG